VATRSIRAGDELLLRAGDTIPADGVMLDGGGAVDEAAFTGEHLPRSIGPGEQVSAGTVLREGGGSMRVECDAASSRLATMLSMLTRAGDKPALARLADRVAARFVGVVLLVAAIVAAYWLQTDPSRALWITLSVLVVSCPCALALATPAALTAATAHLRRRGLLLVGEDSLEALLRCRRVIFDKTGTLTRGELRRRETRVAGELTEAEALALAAALEQQGRHPIAQAFADITPATGLQQVDVVAGRGIRGWLAGRQLAIGSPAFVAETCPQLPDPPQSPGHWIALADQQGPLAWFALEDSPRGDAAQTVQALKQRGLAVELLTGDPSDAGPELAAQLDLDAVRIGASPQDKLDHIRSLQAAGHPVAMVGDGLNDAPVLAAADCAFAVNQATDLAKSQADAILLGSSLGPLDDAFGMAVRCRKIIRQNMGWALAYNGLAVPLAAAGWVPPWAAAVGMSASSLLVVLNSLRLK
jgi:Cu2+-exporting ATPase